MEYIRNDMESLRSALDMMEARADAQEIIDVEYVRKNVDSIDSRRHDMFGNLIANYNGLAGEFDIDPYIKVMSVLVQPEDKNLKERIHLKKESKYKNIRFTPDMVVVRVEREEGRETVEEDLRIDILDFTVTRDKKRAFANKFQKYNIYRELFAGSNCSLTIVAFDIVENDVRMASYWDLMIDIVMPELEDFPDLVQRSEYVKKQMEKKLSADDRRSYEEWLMKKHRSGKDADLELRMFDSNFTLEEFQEFYKKSKNSKRFLSEMVPEEKDFFWNTFLNFCAFEGEEDKLKELSKKLGQHDKVNWMNKTEYEEMLRKEKENIFGNALAHVPKKGNPKKPGQEEISEALEDFNEKAKENYMEVEVGSLLFPIPINYCKNPLTETGPILKKRRIERLVKKLEMLDRGEGDYVTRALTKLLSFSKMDDELYEGFKKGEYIITNDMNVLDPRNYQKAMAELNKKNLRSLENMTFMDQTQFITEQIRLGRLYGVGMKKGEVFNIKPVHDNDVDALKLDAGVGKKVKLEEKEVRTCEKVKSLPFWDEKKSEVLDSEFYKVMEGVMGALVDCNAPKTEKPVPDLPENRTTTSSSEESNSGRETEDLKNLEESFENGLSYWLRSMEVLFENLNFVANMASNGYRIVQTNTDNTLVLTLPSESLFKGDTQVPYIVISIQESKDIHFDFGDARARTYKCKDGTLIHVTMGRRLDRNRMVGYMRVKSVYEDALSCLEEFRKTSGQFKVTTMEKVKLLMYVSNININTSSILDNARYMAELCMANFSFCHEYIKDKFMVPTKNLLQLHLFRRLLGLLKVLNKDMEEVRVRGAITDTEGNVNMEAARITRGKFQSFFFDNISYNKMESLISEIQCLFFSISKGLHGKFHNTISIHKTPISIQDEINKKYTRLAPSSMGPVENREEFNPIMMVIASSRAEESVLGTKSMVRDRVLAVEKLNANPLSGGTTASTKSVLVEDEVKFKFIENSMENLVQSPYLHFMKNEEIDELGYELANVETKIRTCRRHVAKGILKKFKEEMKNKYSEDKAEQELMTDFLENKLKLNWETRRYEFRPQMHRETVKYKAEQVLKRNGNKKPNFYSRGVVVTEVIKRATKKEDGTFYTIGSFAKECVKREKDWRFGISPKGQRTQADREIMILELEGKFGLYPIEHFYKQVSFYIPEEKISESGDQKIISLKSQVESGFKWISRMLGRQKAGDVPEDYKPSILHFNLDMTKWAPRDNLFKFIYTVISSRFLMLEEKLYMVAALLKHSEKKLYIDEEIIYKLGANKDVRLEGLDGRDHDDVFDRMTNGFTTNEVDITLTWLQGQLNYISSMVHTGVMLVFSDYLEKIYAGRIKININCHSDDQETSIYSMKLESDREFVERVWPMISYLTNQVCIEISVKKSFISSLIQLFVSQYNIGGEQVYLWVKSMMSAISGCPYDTLKNDISSVLSKVSEALSKGAPKTSCSLVIKNMKSHLLTIYGIRGKNNENKMAEYLQTEEKYLPTCLGGCHVFDYTTLAIAGPKSIDQMIMMELLKLYGADSVNFGEGRPERLMIGKEKEIRALKLFYILDHLSAETPDEETNNGSFVSSLNPLRSIRFKIRRSGKTDPYWNISNEDAAIMVKNLKARSPGLSILKPVNDQDLVDYYFIMCKNPNFRAALAGQSPNLLMMHKLANKHKGVFRLKESSNITLSKLKEQEDLTSNMTGLELSQILNSLIDNVEFGMTEAEYLWTKYIKCDPEFKVLQFVRENCVKSGAVTKPNPFPIKKPNFDEYSEIVNNVPKLLCWLFDAEYCERNNIRIDYLDAVKNDVEQFVEIFPVEMKKLFSACKGPEGKTKYKNAQKVIENLTAQETTRLTKKLLKIRSVSDTLEKRFRVAIDEELKRLRSAGEIETSLDELIRESQFKEDENYDLSDRLLKMSRAFKGETKKVLFCPPSVSRDFSDITLAMKSQIESSSRITVFYSLNCTQNQAMRLYKLRTTNLKMSRLKEFAVGVSNLYSLCVKMGATKQVLIELLETCKMFDLTINDLRKEFRLLPRYVQVRVIVPLCLMFSNESEILMNTFEPMTIRWEKDEEGPRLEYKAVVYYMNLMVEFSGARKRIENCTIEYVGELEMSALNRVFRSFMGDLIEMNRESGHRYRIFEMYKEMRERQPEESPKVGYNRLRDTIVKGNTPNCNWVFKKMMVKESKGLEVRRRVKDVSLKDGDLSVLVYDEGGRKVEIRHKDYKTQSLHVLEFKDVILNHLSMRKVIKSTMYRNLMTGDLNKITLDQYIDLVDAVGVVTAEIGGYSACIAMNMFTPMNAETDDAWENVKRYVKRFDAYKLCKANAVPVLEKGDEELMKNEELLIKKKARWAEIMDLRRKFDLKYAESVITFFDPSEEMWEQSTESGVSMQDMLDVQNEMYLIDRKLSEEMKKYELGFLLAEACPTPLGTEEKQLASACIYGLMIARAKDEMRFEQQIRDRKEDKSAEIVKMKAIEKICLQCADISINALENDVVDIDLPDFNEAIRGLYEEHRKKISFGTKSLCILWSRVFERRRETKPQVKTLMSLFKAGAEKKSSDQKKQRKMTVLKKSYSKAASEAPELALEARTSLVAAEKLHEISKGYSTGETSTAASDTMTDTEIKKDVDTLRKLYPGITVKSKQKSRLAEVRRERREWLKSLKAPPAQLKFEDLGITAGSGGESDDEIEF